MARSAGNISAADSSALLAWFNHLPLFSRADEFTKEDLSDGTKIWQALREFVPTYFNGELPEGPGSSRRRTSHVGNLQNIKRIYKSIRQYFVEDCGTSSPPGFDDSDLNLIAEGASVADLSLLLKALLCIAILHPSEDGNEPYLLAISELSGEHQGALAKVINELQEAEEAGRHAPPGDKSPRPSSPHAADSDLRNDEQLFRLKSTNKELEREKATLKRDLEYQEERLTRLQQNNSVLQEQLESAQSSLENVTQSADQGYRIRDLEAKNKGQDDYIADLEERFQSAQDRETSLQTKINKLQKANEKVQPLQDEVDELKAAKDSLSRRNNVLERYKNKLQSVQEIENENRALRRELEEVRYQSQEGDGAQQNNTALQREVMELKTLMSNTEIQLVEATNRRKQIEYDNEELLRRLEEAAAQRERDQELVVRMRERDPGLAGSSDGQLMDLDSELESTHKAANEKSALEILLRWNRLTYLSKTQELQTKQERLYRASNEEAARKIALQERLENEKKANAGLQRRNLELTRQNVALEGIMKEPEAEEQYAGNKTLKGAANQCGSKKAFMEMQEKLEAASNDIESLGKENDAFQAQINDAEKTSAKPFRSSLSGANIFQVATYDQEKVEALETLKELNSKECVELRAKIISHEESTADLRLQLDEQRAMLIEALRHSPNPPPNVVVEPPELPPQEEKEDTAAMERMRELMDEVQSAKDREKSQHEVQNMIFHSSLVILPPKDPSNQPVSRAPSPSPSISISRKASISSTLTTQSQSRSPWRASSWFTSNR
jgi:myosin heavy subunit